MELSTLLQKRLIFVSGKGGVGKTTLSVLLALIAARQKKNTLLVEMNTTGRVAPIFDTDSVPHKELPLAPYLSGINLIPRFCFEEYVIKRIRFKTIYNTFFNNTFVNNFIDAVPGLNPILMLGKILELERQIKNRLSDQPQYDLIIVDSPATGHGLSALEVPNVLKSAVKIGPLHHHAVQILDLLGNAEKTVFCLVTLAEELPVAESEEYLQALKERTQLHFGPLFINAVMPQVQTVKLKRKPPEATAIFWKYYELAQRRAELNRFYTDRIEKNFPDLKRIVIPFQFHGLNRHKDFLPLVQAMGGPAR